MDVKRAGGAEIPALGFGTYNLYGTECEQAVRDALEMGYRHIDTAEFYDNHRAVGAGIEASSVPRDDVFLTTKVWKTNLRADAVRDVTETALQELDTSYVDLLLIHWPNESVPIAETIEAMNGLQRDGLVHHIGVSNFSVDQLQAAMDASQTPIVTNQVKYYPGVDRQDLLEFALDEDVLITSYSPLGKGDVVGNDVLAHIGEQYDKSPAQVALRWLIQQPNVVAIPKAAGRDHRYQNRQVYDFELSETEMREIFALGGSLSSSLAERLVR